MFLQEALLRLIKCSEYASVKCATQGVMPTHKIQALSLTYYLLKKVIQPKNIVIIHSTENFRGT